MGNTSEHRIDDNHVDPVATDGHTDLKGFQEAHVPPLGTLHPHVALPSGPVRDAVEGVIRRRLNIKKL